MTEPTMTRQQLRRMVGMVSRMPFYLKYQNGYLNPSSDSTVDLLINAKLTQQDDVWNNGFVYFTSTGALNGIERPIKDFTDNGNSLTLEYPLDTVPAVTDKFEITEVWSPSYIHATINRVIREAEQYFPTVVTDESLVVEEDKLEYDLSSLSVKPWKILQIYLEVPYSVVNGTATGGSTGTLIDTTKSWTANQFASHKVSIYSGTASGQVRDVASNTSDTITLTSDLWATAPSTDSKYKVWDDSVQRCVWRRIIAARFDSSEYPGKIYFNAMSSSFAGYRIRIVYLAHPIELDADSDATTVPTEYILNKTLAYLHTGMIGNTKADSQKHLQVVNTYLQIAELYASTHRRRVPPGTLWVEDDASHEYSLGMNDEIGNPLEL